MESWEGKKTGGRWCDVGLPGVMAVKVLEGWTGSGDWAGLGLLVMELRGVLRGSGWQRRRLGEGTWVGVSPATKVQLLDHDRSMRWVMDGMDGMDGIGSMMVIDGWDG